MKKTILKSSAALLLALGLVIPGALLRAEETSGSGSSETQSESSVAAETSSESLTTDGSKADKEAGSKEESGTKEEKTTEEAKTLSFTEDQLLAQQMLLGTAWFQSSGECRALFLQGYHLAKFRLDTILAANPKPEKPYSIVLDLDETVLDNGPYEASCVEQGRGYDHETWNEWCRLAMAKAVPGAVEFLKYADSKGVQIFYISDRSKEVAKETMENLKKEGIPLQSEDRLMLKDAEDKSGKKNRREKVESESTLVMLFGDNLNDFADFSKKDLKDRLKMTEELQKEFGERFIVFPNPMYGAFESAIYGPEKLDAAGKLEARKKALVTIEKAKELNGKKTESSESASSEAVTSSENAESSSSSEAESSASESNTGESSGAGESSTDKAA